MRARLFTRWFNEFDKRDRFCVKVFILRDEEVDNYIAIIVQKSNPKLNDILRDLDGVLFLFILSKSCIFARRSAVFLQRFE